MSGQPSEHRFASFDGVELAWQDLGAGRALVLIHGLFSNAWTNWIRYGHAARLAEAGHRVIMPDLRGHGLSARPHDAAAYPPDVLARDGMALLAHLDLDMEVRPAWWVLMAGLAVAAVAFWRQKPAGQRPSARRISAGTLSAATQVQSGS